MKKKAPTEENNVEISTTQGYFRCADGLKLYYSMTGPAGAPILLFCYGIVCSTLQWKYQMSHFQKKYRVLYMDYRGHNKSETPTDYSLVTLESLARDLVNLLDELEIENVPVLGHSLGVNVALELYRLAPERVSALILASGTPKDPFETMFQHNFLQPGFELIRQIYFLVPGVIERFWKLQSLNPVNQELIARAGFNRKYANREDINEYLRITGTIELGVFIQLLHDFTRYNACPWLDRISAPTLILGGKADLITPIQNQRILATLIPNAEILEVKEGSHNAQMEFPDIVNARINNFLKDRVFGSASVKTKVKLPATSTTKLPFKKSRKKTGSKQKTLS